MKMDIEEQSISENSIHKKQKVGYDQRASLLNRRAFSGLRFSTFQQTLKLI